MTGTRTARQSSLRVFIAHSSVDIIFARKIRNLVATSTGAKVVTRDDIKAGNTGRKLREELERADAVIGLFTPTAQGWSSFLHEIGAAWALEKTIIPVVARRDVLNWIPIDLTDAPVIEMTERDIDDPSQIERLVRAVEESLGVVAA